MGNELTSLHCWAIRPFADICFEPVPVVTNDITKTHLDALPAGYGSMPNYLQAGYDSRLTKGVGISFDDAWAGNLKATPFADVTQGNVLTPSTSATDDTHLSVVSSSSEFSKLVTKDAQIDLKGWGVKFQASAASSSGITMAKNDVVFLASRRIYYGFAGWATAPAFSQAAKETLCGSTEEFSKIYGDYYVYGHGMGSSMQVITRASAKSTSARESVAAAFTASFSSVFASGSSSAQFTSDLAADSAVASVTTTIMTTGVDAGSSYNSLDLADARDQLVGFASIASSGTGLTTEIRSYQLHQDYIYTLQTCGGVVRQLKKLTDQQEAVIVTELVGLQLLIDWLNEDTILTSDDKTTHKSKVWNKISEIETAVEGEITAAAVAEFDGSAEALTEEFYLLLDTKTSTFLGTWSSDFDGVKIWYDQDDDNTHMHYDIVVEISFNSQFGVYQAKWGTAGTLYDMEKYGENCMSFGAGGNHESLNLNPNEPDYMTFLSKHSTYFRMVLFKRT